MNKPGPAHAIEKREAAYEIKFLVGNALTDSVLDWARVHLAPDPHGGSGAGDGYGVNSLYFDTSGLHVYRRKGSFGKAKYRIRRYGEEDQIFLERKLKSRGLVSKRRTRVPDEDLVWLTAEDTEPDWSGYWFRRRILARQLLPRCQIRYERVARVGMSPDGPVRLTVDRNVRGFVATAYGVLRTGSWLPLLEDHCILELKFRQQMPPLFTGLIESLGLKPQPVSKYRLSIQAFGLAPSEEQDQQDRPTEPDGALEGAGSVAVERNGSLLQEAARSEVNVRGQGAQL